MRNSAMHVLKMDNNYYATLLHKRAKLNNNVTFKYPRTNLQAERRSPLFCFTVPSFETGYPGCRFS
jgi:hypothetical protein